MNQKLRDMEYQLEYTQNNYVSKNNSSGRIDISVYNSLKKDLEYRKNEESKYKSVLQEQSDMIDNYKDLIETDKESHFKISEDNKNLYLEKIRLEKEVEDLNNLVKIYEERNESPYSRLDPDQKHYREEISKLIYMNDDLKNVLQKKEEKIIYLKKTIKNLTDNLRLETSQKTQALETEREKNHKYKNSLHDIKLRLNDLEGCYNSSIKNFNEPKHSNELLKKIDLNKASKENIFVDHNSHQKNTDKFFDISSSRNSSVFVRRVDRVSTQPNIGKEKFVIKNFKNAISGFERKLRDIQGRLQDVSFED